MNRGPKNLSLIERVAMTALVFIATAVGAQSLLHSMRKSEERTLNAAAIEYSTVRSMYAEPSRPHSFDTAPINSNRLDNSGNRPIE